MRPCQNNTYIWTFSLAFPARVSCLVHAVCFFCVSMGEFNSFFWYTCIFLKNIHFCGIHHHLSLVRKFFYHFFNLPEKKHFYGFLFSTVIPTSNHHPSNLYLQNPILNPFQLAGLFFVFSTRNFAESID